MARSGTRRSPRITCEDKACAGCPGSLGGEGPWLVATDGAGSALDKDPKRLRFTIGSLDDLQNERRGPAPCGASTDETLLPSAIRRAVLPFQRVPTSQRYVGVARVQ